MLEKFRLDRTISFKIRSTQNTSMLQLIVLVLQLFCGEYINSFVLKWSL